MRLLVKATLVSALLMAVSASAIDKEIQIDLLMSKVMTALKEHREEEALPAMEKLEAMEPTLSKPLPEGFHYLYIETLYKAGKNSNALTRANIYMNQFGKKGKNYGKVVEMMVVLQEKVDYEIAMAKKNEDARKAQCEKIVTRYCQVYYYIHQPSGNFSMNYTQELYKKLLSIGNEMATNACKELGRPSMYEPFKYSCSFD